MANGARIIEGLKEAVALSPISTPCWQRGCGSGTPRRVAICARRRQCGPKTVKLTSALLRPPSEPPMPADPAALYARRRPSLWDLLQALNREIASSETTEERLVYLKIWRLGLLRRMGRL